MKKLILLLLLTACSPPQQTMTMAGGEGETASAWANGQAETASTTLALHKDERLGTVWGQSLQSRVETDSDLVRSGSTPLEEVSLNYGSRAPGSNRLRSINLLAGQVELRVLGEKGALPLSREAGRYYLHGREGERYRLHYRNHSNKTYEIVASVDGLNVITGRAARRQDSGYVLPPQGELTIDGFRRDRQSVAAFTFGRPSDSYAAHSDHGSVNNSGIIGTVLYELQKLTPPEAFPGDGPWAPPPRR